MDAANRDDQAQTDLYYGTKGRLAKFQEERGVDVVVVPMAGKDFARFIGEGELDYMCTYREWVGGWVGG